MLSTIIRHQLQQALRDQRVRWLAIALVLAGLAALLSGLARQQRLSAEREAAIRADAEAWSRQGVVDPHGAAHFGRTAFKPISLLSALDPGLLDHIGSLVRLEAHKQNVASGRPSDAGTALTAFVPFTAASALQIFAPVLIILAGFGVFSGEAARQILRLELAAGIPPRVLLMGRFLALGGGIVGVLGLFGFAGGVGLWLTDAPAPDFARLGLLLVGYGAYLLTFLALTLGISALCVSARPALAVLLAFWLATVLLVPRIGPSLSAQVYPVPSVPVFANQVSESIDDGLDGHDPRHTRMDRLRARAMAQYGVTRIEDLPVNFGGLALEYGEAATTRAYQQHFDALFTNYERQSRLLQALSPLSPRLPLQGWSAGLAETDFAAHRAFLQDAEQYRYAFVQALNQAVVRSTPGQPRAAVRVADITAEVDRAAGHSVTLGETWRRQWSNGVLLLTWLGLSVGFALWAAGRLHRLS
jgi:ABC-2 type transport system permease protein